MSKQYQSVASARPGYTRFDVSYDKKLTCDMGELIPSYLAEVLPGDIFKIGVISVVRMQPLVAPVLHPVDIYFHYFFVPNRIMWSSWETFITGGLLGTDATAIPVWDPTTKTEGSLWDYMEMPTGVEPDANHRPVDFIKRAYNWVYNEYYRDENLVTAIDPATAEAVQKRAWSKDFFTSALPWLQRGTAPALPVALSGVINVTGKNEDITVDQATGGSPKVLQLNYQTLMVPSTYGDVEDMRWVNTALEVDMSSGVATSFNINDLRLAISVQKWMERNARAGIRYIEHITAHFGNVAPKDSRLQRPEYIGGTKAPIVVSEVLQTSASGLTGGTTPQANLAGHGIGVVKDFCAKYRATEHGIIIGIMSIMPRAVYQQGIDRQWLKTTRYDYYSPEFANLGEQAIETVELYTTAVEAENEVIFGFQGRWDQYRTRRSVVCGELRSSLDHWHMSRQFAAAPELNQAFIECVPRKDCFAAPSVDGFIVNVGNIVQAIRPLPYMAEPGLKG